MKPKYVLETTIKILEVLGKQLRNKDLYDYISDKLKLVEKLKNVTYENSDNYLNISGNYGKDLICIEIKLNNGTIKSINTIVTDWDKNKKEKKEIIYKDNAILVNEKELNIYKYERSNEVASINTKKKKSLYIDNEIVYNFENISTIECEDDKRNYSHEEEMFIFPNKSAIKRSVSIGESSSFYPTAINYYKTNNCTLPGFNTRDIKGHGTYMYGMDFCTKEEYEKMLYSTDIKKRVYKLYSK